MTTRIISLVTLSLILCCAVSARFQNREHLTEKEIELVKDTQILDKRIDVFIKAADRRLLALKLTTSEQANPKKEKKEAELWGDLPAGSRAELINDIAKILDEAITNIDDVSLRDEKNPLIGKSLRKLAAAATRITTQLKPLQSQITGAAESSIFDQLIDNAESIVQAAAKLPPDVARTAKGKKPAEKN